MKISRHWVVLLTALLIAGCLTLTPRESAALVGPRLLPEDPNTLLGEPDIPTHGGVSIGESFWFNWLVLLMIHEGQATQVPGTEVPRTIRR